MTSLLAMGLLIVVAGIASYTDWRWGKVYNWLTYSAMLAGIGLATLGGWAIGGWPGAVAGLRSAAAGLAVGLVPFVILFVAGGVNGGDVKLMGAIGAICANVSCVLNAMVYGLLIGGLLAIVVMVRHGVVGQTLRRIGNAAIMAAARVKPELTDQGPKVPYAVALGLGAILAGIEHWWGWRIW